MAEPRTRIRQTVAKTMFAISGNQCYFPGCEERVAHPIWEKCNGELAHICGERKGAPRYDASLSVKDRNDCWNLLVLCPKHHKLIDQLEPTKYPVEVLRTMKETHEKNMEHATNWATDAELTLYVMLLLQPEYEGPVITDEADVPIAAEADAPIQMAFASEQGSEGSVQITKPDRSWVEQGGGTDNWSGPSVAANAGVARAMGEAHDAAPPNIVLGEVELDGGGVISASGEVNLVDDATVSGPPEQSHDIQVTVNNDVGITDSIGVNAPAPTEVNEVGLTDSITLGGTAASEADIAHPGSVDVQPSAPPVINGPRRRIPPPHPPTRPGRTAQPPIAAMQHPDPERK